MDAQVLGEKFVGPGDGVLAQILLADGMDLRARGEGVGDLAFGVARLDHVAGKQADEPALAIHDRKGAERKFAFLDHSQHVADELVRRDGDRFLDQAMNVVFDAAHLGQLLVLRHVVMDEAEAAVGRHGNGHARLGHGVHVGRNDRNVEMQVFREPGVKLRVTRENLRIQRRERDVVEGQTELVVRREKLIRRLVERIVETGLSRHCHVG